MDDVEQVIADARKRADAYRAKMVLLADLALQLVELNRVLENAVIVLRAQQKLHGVQNGHTPRG